MKLENFKEQFEVLEKRKKHILKTLLDDEVLTPELQQKIESSQDITSLEDLYLPYKKKRKTKAETARKNGLEPLAKIIMSQNANAIESIAYKYVKGEISSVDEALEGARHIIAEWINERTDIRNNIRHQLERYAIISTKAVKTKIEDEKAQKFRDSHIKFDILWFLHEYRYEQVARRQINANKISKAKLSKLAKLFASLKRHKTMKIQNAELS